jgi:hypothetical protein
MRPKASAPANKTQPPTWVARATTWYRRSPEFGSKWSPAIERRFNEAHTNAPYIIHAAAPCRCSPSECFPGMKRSSRYSPTPPYARRPIAAMTCQTLSPVEMLLGRTVSTGKFRRRRQPPPARDPHRTGVGCAGFSTAAHFTIAPHSILESLDV